MVINLNFFLELMANRVLITAILGWLVAQVLKVILVLICDKRFDITRMIGSGGMPSSHSSFVTSLATAVAFESGVSSPLFAVCGVLAFVVMYDASGVRRETGRQAEIINDIIESFGAGNTQLAGKKLKELIGHSPIEVLAGAILGVVIGLLMYLL